MLVSAWGRPHHPHAPTLTSCPIIPSSAQVDLALAREQAEAPLYDRELKRKLWLRIAQHVMENEHNVQKAMEVLKDYPELKIEDILPFFPDFVQIDPFQEHIQHSLELYNEQIQVRQPRGGRRRAVRSHLHG